MYTDLFHQETIQSTLLELHTKEYCKICSYIRLFMTKFLHGVWNTWSSRYCNSKIQKTGKLKICPNITSREILKNQETFNYQLDFENNFQSNVREKSIYVEDINIKYTEAKGMEENELLSIKRKWLLNTMTGNEASIELFWSLCSSKPKINKTYKRNASIYGHFQKGLYNRNDTQLPGDENFWL